MEKKDILWIIAAVLGGCVVIVGVAYTCLYYFKMRPKRAKGVCGFCEGNGQSEERGNDSVHEVKTKPFMQFSAATTSTTKK